MTFRALAQSLIDDIDGVMGEDAGYEAWLPATSTFAASIPLRFRPINRDQFFSGYGGEKITGETLYRISVAALSAPEKKSRITHNGKIYVVTSFDRPDPLGLDWVLGCRKA